MEDLFIGTGTALLTPFDKNGVNKDEYKKILDRQISSGVSSVIILGTTGEPPTMTLEEKKDLISFAVNYCKGKIKTIVGSGSNSTETAISMSKYAEEVGADALLVITPYYNKCTQKGLLKYYEDIAGSVKIPIIAYNVPGRTGVNILPETAGKIAEIPNVAGIKEASGNMEQIMETALKIKGKCSLYSGDDALTLPMMSIGAKGVISVLSNIIPEDMVKFVNTILSGDLKTAINLHEKLLPLAKAMFLEVSPIPVKTAAKLLGSNIGNFRAPLTDMEDSTKEKLIAIMKGYGLKIIGE